jgi:hypothetical protein
MSTHPQGLAADVGPLVKASAMAAAVADLHARALRLEAAGQLPRLGGLGFYPGRWIHVDIRPRKPGGVIAQWTGAGVGSEIA